MAATLLLVFAFSVFSFPALQPWDSWGSVHSHIWQVNIVDSVEKFKAIQLEWWGVFAISAVYILASFAIGEESRDAFKWITKQLTNQRRAPEVPKLHLPLLWVRYNI